MSRSRVSIVTPGFGPRKLLHTRNEGVGTHNHVYPTILKINLFLFILCISSGSEVGNTLGDLFHNTSGTGCVLVLLNNSGTETRDPTRGRENKI